MYTVCVDGESRLGFSGRLLTLIKQWEIIERAIIMKGQALSDLSTKYNELPG